MPALLHRRADLGALVRQYGGTNADDAKRRKEVAAENTMVKWLLADAKLDGTLLRKLC